MVPQSGLPVAQIFGVEQKLILCFLFIVLSVQNPAHVGQKQHGHKQGVVPKLALVHAVRGNVLQTSLLGSGEIRHNPVRPLSADLQVIFPAQMLRQKGQGQHGRHGIHIFCRQADGKLPLVIFIQNRQIPLFPGRLKQLPVTEESNALGPFPELVPPDVIAGQAVFLHPLEKGFILFVEHFLEAGGVQPQRCFDRFLVHIVVHPLFHIICPLRAPNLPANTRYAR